MQNRTDLLVCDLDNTLYDWVSYFVPAFYSMIDAAVTIMSCDREQLLDDMRAVHQCHHDSEQPFALLETMTVKEHFRGYPLQWAADSLDPAFHAFNSSRSRNLRLYDGVFETLDILTGNGVTLVAHTESKLHGALDRLRRLDLLKYFQRIYCRERSETSHPDRVRAGKWMADLPLEIVRELSHHQSKPNRDVLLEICATEGVRPENAAYVGDSVAKDMLMAKRANVFAIWAAYGTTYDKALYDGLVRVTHWTQEDVAREVLLRDEAIRVHPDYVAKNSFKEILMALNIPGKVKSPFEPLPFFHTTE
jgi:FMN phosphatase YigB (HAD superfamily)